jgi:hypothetical protein
MLSPMATSIHKIAIVLPPRSRAIALAIARASGGDNISAGVRAALELAAASPALPPAARRELAKLLRAEHVEPQS